MTPFKRPNIFSWFKWLERSLNLVIHGIILHIYGQHLKQLKYDKQEASEIGYFNCLMMHALAMLTTSVFVTLSSLFLCFTIENFKKSGRIDKA